jgi:hypothetical protein
MPDLQVQSNKKIKKGKEKKELIFGRTFLKKENIILYKNSFFEVNYFSPFYEFDKETSSFKYKEKELTKEFEFFGKLFLWKKKKMMPIGLFNAIENYFNPEKILSKKKEKEKEKENDLFCYFPFYEAKNE